MKYFVLFLENRFPCVMDTDSESMLFQPMIDMGRDGETESKLRTIAEFRTWVAANYPGQDFDNDYTLVDTPDDVCRLCGKMNLPDTDIEMGMEVFDYASCSRCFNTYCKWCTYCDEGFHINEMRNARGREGERVLCCMPCFEEHVHQCAHCGTATTSDRCHRCDIGVTYYSAKPTYDPKGDGPIWYGIELEVEVIGGERDQDYDERNPYVDEVAQQIKPLFPADYCIMKEDNSLDGGFEICTRPASVEYHKHAMGKFLKRGHKDLRSWDTGTCGIHVHVSRAPLTELQIGKMLVFIHDFTDFTQRIAQRISPYGDFSAKKKITDARYHGEARDGQARHEALNLTGNDTVELRIFRGTLNAETFWKCIEFTEALVHFTGTGQFGIKEIRPENFIKFVLRRQKQWPNLAAFLRKPFKPVKPLTQRENNTYRPSYRINRDGLPVADSRFAEAFDYRPPSFLNRPRTRPPEEDLCRDRNCRECYPENPVEVEFDTELRNARADRLVNEMMRNPEYPVSDVHIGSMPAPPPPDRAMTFSMPSDPSNWAAQPIEWTDDDEAEFNMVTELNEMIDNEIDNEGSE